MVRIETKELTIYVPIEQIKRMYYDKNEKSVLIICTDDHQIDKSDVIGVYLNNEKL